MTDAAVTGRKWFARFAVLCFIAASGVWISHAWRTGSVPSLVAEVTVVVAVLYLTFNERIARVIPTAQRWRVSADSRGTIFSPNIARMVAFISAVMLLLLGLLTMGVLQMFGILAAPTRIPPTARDQALLGLAPIVGVACGVLALLVMGSLVRGFASTGSKVGSLVVGRGGISILSRRGIALPWDAIHDVRVVGKLNAAGRAQGKLDLIVDGEPKPLKYSLNLLPGDAPVLADVLLFYW